MWLQVLSTSMIGIIAGIYLIFSNAIMPALKEVKNGAAIMVKINKVILNAVFKIIFIFSAISSAYLGLFASDIDLAYRVACVIFFIGTFVVTIFRNVPLNERLKNAVDEQEDVNETWRLYLVSWVKWNHVRTASAILAVLLASFSIHW